VTVYRGQLGTPAPHLLYANLEFGKPNAATKSKSLLSVPGWTDTETLQFLAKHQQEFRRCLEWLSNGAQKNFGLDDDGSDDLWSVRMERLWEQQPEVQFLQQHGLAHAQVLLQPGSQDGSYFGGLALDQGKPKDPLDPICGYLLALLAWEGTVGVRKCDFEKCGNFFRALTTRKRFCSSDCRAKSAAAKKTPEEKRIYMRDYRALVKQRTSGKAHAAAQL